MSFADYGFDIFLPAYKLPEPGCISKNLRHVGIPKCAHHDNNELEDLEKKMCYNVMSHLVDLGMYTENELMRAKEELKKYKNLQSDFPQSSESVGYRSEDSEKFIRDTNLDCENGSFSVDDRPHSSENSARFSKSSRTSSWRFPRIPFFGRRTEAEVAVERVLKEEDEEEAQVSPSAEESGECTETQHENVSSQGEEPRQEQEAEDAAKSLSDESFRTAIIAKDSEIICLKTENAVKDSELRELEQHSKKLEVMIEKLKTDIELLETTSRISESELQELIRKKNQEIDVATQSSMMLERDLKEERMARKLDARELQHLRSFIQETKACNRSICDELKATKRRLEAFESSNASYVATIKALQQERDELDKQIGVQEVEIERLLKIVQRLHEMYDSAKEKLYSSSEELMSRERQVEKCRRQLETTELEVGKLISDLAECLGQANHVETTRRTGIYAQAREMTRALQKIVREHLECNAHRAELMREIGRLRAQYECWDRSQMVQVQMSSDGSDEYTISDSDRNSERRSSNSGQPESNRSIQQSLKANIKEIPVEKLSIDQAERNRVIQSSKKDEISVAKHSIIQTESNQSVQSSVSETAGSVQLNEYSMDGSGSNQSIRPNPKNEASTGEATIESNQSIQSSAKKEVSVSEKEKKSVESENLETRNQTSVVSNELDRNIIVDEENKRFKVLLLQELDNLEKALIEAQKISSGLDLSDCMESKENAMNEAYETESKRILGDCEDYSASRTGPILQRLQDLTKVVIKIMAVMRIGSASNIEHLMNLQERIEKNLVTLKTVDSEKCQLQIELKESQKECVNLAKQVKSLEGALASKSDELKSLVEKKAARYESWRKEVEEVRNQLVSTERKLKDSLAENSNLARRSEEAEAKVMEHGKFNDYLNGKLKESNRMIEQLQETIREESALKAEYAGFDALHERIRELVKEKEALKQKMAKMDSQLADYGKDSATMQANLAKILQDNDYLEKCIRTFKLENERLEASIADKAALKVKIGGQFDELLQKIETISRNTSKFGIHGPSDAMIRGLEKDIKSHQEKLRIQQKELQSREKEISDKNKRIETLNSQISKAKVDVTTDNASILKRIEVLTLEKAELRSELKLTLVKYEEKLAEMHKQFKHNEAELHKSHNESIKRLEAKYADIVREQQTKPFDYETWLESLGAGELQKIHDKVCMSLRKATHEKDALVEQQRRRTLASRSTNSSCVVKKTIPPKKDTIKTASAPRPFSRTNGSRPPSDRSDRTSISFRNRK